MCTSIIRFLLYYSVIGDWIEMIISRQAEQRRNRGGKQAQPSFDKDSKSFSKKF